MTPRIAVLQAPGGRPVELWLFDPPQPVRTDPVAIVFSHGANSAPDRYRRLLDVWAAAGFMVCAPLHCDSEDHPNRCTGNAAELRQSRLDDFALAAAAAAGGAFGLPKPMRFIAAGHSYGALIAQVAAGAVLLEQAGAIMPASPLPIGVIALSPPPPMPGLVDERCWANIHAPMLCVTGTADIMPGFVDDWRQHLASHHAAPRSVALVAEAMDHYFGGAFGRLGDEVSETAVATLNDAVLACARGWASGDAAAPDRWLAEAAPESWRL